MTRNAIRRTVLHEPSPGERVGEVERIVPQGPAIAEWRGRDDFIAFLARQSDWSCAGWNPAEPVFHLDAPWRHRRQRL